MGRAPKRFIKKVPPSGAAPVFKLTLPHRIVHTHLSHLIGTDFEIAVSATASHSWQGTIAPRRNKDRSEYTLQGWRLFAEAHHVQPGDQVSFELVSPRRLVVQVISTEECSLAVQSNSNATSPMQEDNPDAEAQDLPPIMTNIEEVRRQPWLSANQNQSEPSDMLQISQHMPGSARSGESLHVGDGGQTARSQGPLFGRDCSSPLPPSRPYPQSSRMLVDSATAQLDSRHHSLESTPLPSRNWQMPPPMMPNLLNAYRSGSFQAQSGHSGLPGDLPQNSSSMAGRLGQHGLSGGSSNVQLNFQLLNLTSTIQSQQADLQFYEARARKAEYESSQLRILFGELRSSLDAHSRAILHAGEALEKLSGKLGSSETLTAASPGLADTLMALQAEMYVQVDKLKSSLLHMMSIEL